MGWHGEVDLYYDVKGFAAWLLYDYLFGPCERRSLSQTSHHFLQLLKQQNSLFTLPVGPSQSLAAYEAAFQQSGRVLHVGQVGIWAPCLPLQEDFIIKHEVPNDPLMSMSIVRLVPREANLLEKDSSALYCLMLGFLSFLQS